MDLNTFYTFTEFKELPSDEQVAYLNNICEVYKVSASTIATYVFGMSESRFVKYLKENGLFESVNPEHYKASRSSYMRLKAAVNVAHNPVPTAVDKYLKHQNIGTIKWNVGSKPDKPGEYWAILIRDTSIEDYSGEPVAERVAEMAVLYCDPDGDHFVWRGGTLDIIYTSEIYAWAPLEETPFPQLPNHVASLYETYSTPADE